MEHPGACWPQFASGGDSADSPVPLLVSRFLTGDDRYVMSWPVTILVAARERPSKTSYFSGQNRHHKLLKPKTSYYRGRTVLLFAFCSHASLCCVHFLLICSVFTCISLFFHALWSVCCVLYAVLCMLCSVCLLFFLFSVFCSPCPLHCASWYAVCFR